MDEFTTYFGIDVSKDVFDVSFADGQHQQFRNNRSGFKDFLKYLNQQAHLVMEATGCYHQPLASFFYQASFKVSVVNSVVIKRFTQMRLRHTKTDKADAHMIRLYAEKEHPPLWHPRPAYSECRPVETCMEHESVIRLLLKQRTALKNKLHSLQSKGSSNQLVIKLLRKQVKEVSQQVDKLETDMELLVETHQPAMLTSLSSIPGMGRKTAMFLMVLTNCFERFENSKQVSAFVGLAPMQRVSGSSVRGKSRISKAGNSTLRNLLFMCSFTACIHNPACQQLYERLVAKGKSKKLALIAVANKLVKQAFALAQSGLMYDKEYGCRKPAY